MTEEVIVPVEGQEEVVQKELSPVEQDAISQGWVPKEEFEGDEAKWVDAGEFIRRGELFKKIDHQNREIKEVRRALQGFKEHYTKVNETAYNRALAALKAEHKTANREGDFEKADRIETQIESVEQEAAQVKEQISTVSREAAEIHPEFAAWVSKNDWYATQRHMKTFADDKGLEFAKLGLSPTEVLKKVEAEVRKEFPSKFRNPNQDRPGTVETSSNRGTSRTKSDGFELTAQEEKIMNDLVRGNVLTKAEYLADIKAQRGTK